MTNYQQKAHDAAMAKLLHVCGKHGPHPKFSERCAACEAEKSSVSFSPYRSLDYIKTPEQLEAYVQERIRAEKSR